jgi:hypothetical protein
MQRTEDSWHSSLDFNLAHPEYRRDSSVSIVTELRVGQLWNNFFFLYSRQLEEIIFILKGFQAGCVAHPAPAQWLSEALSTGGAKWQGSEVNHLPLVPRLRTTGAMLQHHCVPASKKLYPFSLAAYPPVLGCEFHIL